MGLTQNLQAALVFYLLLAGSHNLSRPIFSDYLNREIENKQRATALSLISSVSGLYVAGAGLVLGKIGDLFSIQATFLAAGLFILVLSLALWKLNFDLPKTDEKLFL
jgi:MFS family permease